MSSRSFQKCRCDFITLVTGSVDPFSESKKITYVSFNRLFIVFVYRTFSKFCFRCYFFYPKAEALLVLVIQRVQIKFRMCI